jgi:cyclopropane fatty-acyl-phospholipid synthase-like methyltransferase
MKARKIKFSKSIGDVVSEKNRIVDMESRLQAIVVEATGHLSSYPDRRNCLLCGSDVALAEQFLHRKIKFLHCHNCGHVQTQCEPDGQYEEIVASALGYKEIYPDSSWEDFQSRTERVYQPKLEWIIEGLGARATKAELANLSWLDIGCGAGYFLNALIKNGFSNCAGTDLDVHNLAVAEKYLDGGQVFQSETSVADTIKNAASDVITAFYVLEHVSDMKDVIDALSRKEQGTIFVFAVPVFSFISIFEGLVEKHYPRSLDAMVHTQIFTDESIDYMMEKSGFEIVSEWIFGQDIADIHRFIDVGLNSNYPQSLRDQFSQKFAKLIDPLQMVLDGARFSDSRHIIAIKK